MKKIGGILVVVVVVGVVCFWVVGSVFGGTYGGGRSTEQITMGMIAICLYYSKIT